MTKIIWMVLVIGLCSGCSRAYWVPNYDKALTEREQCIIQERQTKALERIANSLENIEKQFRK